MTRYKGPLKASRIEQEYPHHVDIVVPPGVSGRDSTRCTPFTTSTASTPSEGTASTALRAISFGGASRIQI